MGLNWKSVEAVHVTQACEALLKSAGPRAKLRGLIVIYKDTQIAQRIIKRFDHDPELKARIAQALLDGGLANLPRGQRENGRAQRRAQPGRRLARDGRPGAPGCRAFDELS